jgi:hypothetical protein
MSHPAVDMRDILEAWMKDAMDRAQAIALDTRASAGDRLRYMNKVMTKVNITTRDVMSGIDAMLDVEKMLEEKW